MCNMAIYIGGQTPPQEKFNIQRMNMNVPQMIIAI